MKFFTCVIISLLCLSINAQDPILQKSNETLEEVAQRITKSYDDYIALDGNQFILFRKKVEEFLIREERIHAQFTGKEKLDELAKLRAAETLEMRNILTQPQLTVYKKVKPEIQPLAVIKER
jgi:hypothetical protein